MVSRYPIGNHQVIVSILAVLASCQARRHLEYAPPAALESTPTYTKLVEAPFNEVWRALISGVGGSFFGIEEFERESGLLTLSFTSSPFSDAVTGGRLVFRYNNADKRSGEIFWVGHASEPAMNINFDGDYADYVQQYLNGQFQGRANIVVAELSATRTEIIVNQRFVVTGGFPGKPGAGVETVVWAWNAGESCTQVVTTDEGNREARVLRSTGMVEDRLQRAIELALEQRL